MRTHVQPRKRRRVGIFFLLLLFLVGLMVCLPSCGGGGRGSDDGGDGERNVDGSSAGGVVIPQTTKVLDDSTLQKLTLISEDGSTLTFSGATAQLESLSAGDVIVVGVSAVTPQGLLRKVSTLSRVDGQLVVETTQATLEEAIQSGSFEVSKTLTPNDANSAVALKEGVSLMRKTALAQALEGFYIEVEDVVLYDRDGNPDTENDQIRADGFISFNPSIDFRLKVDGFQVRQLAFVTTTKETAKLELMAEIEAEIEKKVEIARYNFTPITLLAGPFPMVITPVLTVNLGLDAEVYVGITTSVTQEATLAAGLSYDNGQWSPISNLSVDFVFDPPRPSAGVNLKGYAGPQLNLLIYGVAGPYGSISGYLELESDVFADPWWQLYGGVEADVGVRVEVLSWVMVDYEWPEVIGYRKLLAEADTPYAQSGTISGSVRDAVTASPLGGVTVYVYQEGVMRGSALSNSNGSYSSSVPAGAGYSVEFSKSGYLPAGYHNITVEANATTHLEVVLQIDIGHYGTGNISGEIVNALDGTGVSGLAIKLRAGINVNAGSVVATTTGSVCQLV